MADRKVYPLRVDRRLYDALERWAADDLRSVNAQIEFLLRESLRRAGRLAAAAGRRRGPCDLLGRPPCPAGQRVTRHRRRHQRGGWTAARSWANSTRQGSSAWRRPTHPGSSGSGASTPSLASDQAKAARAQSEANS
jgi:hypothetical protein